MAKLPLITIVGVPNTGKSTLFNRLIGKRKALVHKTAGMTRDIFCQLMEIDGTQYLLQDSGGFFTSKDEINQEINRRVYQSAELSDLIIFLLDGKRELLGYEQEFFLAIRKINKNIITVVNKADKPDTFIVPNDYYQLSQDLVPISAEHNINIDLIREEIALRLKGKARKEKIRGEIRIGFYGKPNVGKSSLINAILRDDSVIVSEKAGTTRDSLEISFFWKEYLFTLVDNAGLRKLQKVRESTEGAAILKAEHNIKHCDVVILTLDANLQIEQNDLFVANHVLKSARPVILLFNKWDLVQDKNSYEKIKKYAYQKFNKFYFASFLLASAKSSHNVFQVLDEVIDIHERLNHKIKISDIIKSLKEIIAKKKLSHRNGVPFNPKFSVIESRTPFFLKFFASESHPLKDEDEIYLKKALYDKLDLRGIPIFFKVARKRK